MSGPKPPTDLPARPTVPERAPSPGRLQEEQTQPRMSDERVERAVRADGRDVRAALMDGDRHGELLGRPPTRRRRRGRRASGPGGSRAGRIQPPVRARRQPAGARAPRPPGPAGGAWPLRTTGAGRRRSTPRATRWRRRPGPPRRPGLPAERSTARWSDTARPGRCSRCPCRAAGPPDPTHQVRRSTVGPPATRCRRPRPGVGAGARSVLGCRGRVPAVGRGAGPRRQPPAPTTWPTASTMGPAQGGSGRTPRPVTAAGCASRRPAAADGGRAGWRCRRPPPAARRRGVRPRSRPARLRVGPGRVGVRVVALHHDVVDADDVALPDGGRVVDGAEPEVAPEHLARQEFRGPRGALAAGRRVTQDVVGPVHQHRDPPDAALGQRHLQVRKAERHAGPQPFAGGEERVHGEHGGQQFERWIRRGEGGP